MIFLVAVPWGNILTLIAAQPILVWVLNNLRLMWWYISIDSKQQYIKKMFKTKWKYFNYG